MVIAKDKMVAIDYTLKDKDGKVIDSSKDAGALEYLHGHGNLISGLEKELEGKSAGDSFSVTIPPEEAYGTYNKELVVNVPKDQFDTDVEIEVGMQFQANTAGGGQIVTVTAVTDKEVTVDANHPLAGQTLYFDVTVASVREATPEELAPRPVSGCGGGCGGCSGCGSSGGCGSSCGSGCGC